MTGMNWKWLVLLVPLAVGCSSKKDTCTVGDNHFTAGTVDPSNPCRTCQPATNADGFTPVADGAACGAGQVCAAATCQAKCFIDGAVVASGAVDPANVCGSCQPARSTTSYSSTSDGLSCAPGKVCANKACSAACFLAGAVVDAGAFDAEGCRTCQPAESTTTYTPLSDGYACASGHVCISGNCFADCFIGGQRVAAGTGPSACNVCQPAISTSQTTLLSDGTACGSGLVCESGACTAGCFIGGVAVATDAVNPANPCQKCTPATSTSAYSPIADGTGCGGELICSAGTCQSGCLIAGVFHAAGATQSQGCQTCSPVQSVTAWTNAANGTACSACDVCTAGACGAAVLGAPTPRPQGLTLDGPNAYYVDFLDHLALEAAVDGGTASTVASSFVSPVATARLNGELYVLDYGGKGIFRVTDGGTEALGPSMEQPYHLIGRGGRLFWANHGDTAHGFPGSVGSLAPDGGDVIVYQTGTSPTDVTTDATTVYWTDAELHQVRWTGLWTDGGATQSVASSGTPISIVNDATSVYWLTAEGSLLRLSKSDGGTTTLAGGTLINPKQILIDGTNMYVVENPSATSGQVIRFAVNNVSAGAPLLGQSEQALSIATDNQCVYWTNAGASGSLLRADK